MRAIGRWLLRIVGVLFAVVLLFVAAVGGGGVWLVRRPWPRTRGTVEVPGPAAPVEIVRDRWGVPHIYAEGETDLFFAQGYVHAQDRLWQMEDLRRLSSGTTSEVIGYVALDYDRFVRTIGVRRLAEQSWLQVDDDTRTILEAYAAGVNAYVNENRDRLPWEFAALGVEPEPWTPVDSLALANYQAWNEGFNAMYELLRTEFIAELGREKALQMPVLFPSGPSVIFPEETTGANPQPAACPTWLAGVDERPGNPSARWGSSNWVVDGRHTASGMPILADDPHVVLYLPSLFYENGLHGGRFHSVGFTIPGVPLAIVGHNEHIAWGIANLNADFQDMYVERLDGLFNPTQYEFAGEWRDVELIEETIDVAGSRPSKLRIHLTHHGPILREMPHSFIFAMTAKAPPGTPMSFNWSVDGASAARTLRSIVLLNLATNWTEFREALRHWETLPQNFVYADVEGNIGHQAAAKVPLRVPGHQGLLPVPGWTGDYEWQGFVPFDDLPSTLNPPDGLIVTANNDVTPEGYPYVLSHEYAPPHRAERIIEMLFGGDLLDVEDMAGIQADTYSAAAEALRPHLLAIEPESSLHAEALDRVRGWDLRVDTDSVGASILQTWLHFLMRNTLGDECGDLVENHDLNTEDHVHQTLMMIDLLADDDNAWFDNVRTPRVETRDEIVRRSLVEALDWLCEQLGENPAEWEWGRLHQATFRHELGWDVDLRSIVGDETLARIVSSNSLARTANTAIERALNSEPVPVPGDLFSVNAAGYRGAGKQPFEVYYGAVVRMIVDVSDWDNAQAVLVPGQSGHILHPHQEDQIALWQNVDYRPMPFSREAVERNAGSRLTIKPRQ